MKRSVYAVFFIVINVLYLIVELTFNARLLDVSATMSLSTDFNQLELYGRSISAAGATLLFWRLLIPFQPNFNLGRALIKFILILLIVFPTVFMGQKKIIDSLVDSSTAEMRRSAEILSVLKYGISHGFIEINELSMDATTLLSAEGKMFLTLAGFLIYSSQHELEKLEKQLDVIASYAVTTQQKSDAELSYRNYQYASFKIVEFYQRYAQLVSVYDQQQNMARSKSIILYEKALFDALKHWQFFAAKRMAVLTDYQLMLMPLQEHITGLQVSVEHCQTASCVVENGSTSIALINRLIGADSQWQHWCVLPTQKTQLICSSEPQVVSHKLEKLAQKLLVQQFGFELYYETKIDYLKSREFFDSVLLSLEKNQVPLITETALNNHELIIDEIQMHISMFNKQQYDHKVAQLLDVSVRPKLSLGQFSLLPKMQLFYQQAMADLYLSPLPIGLSRDDFIKRFMQPAYAKQYEYLANKLSADSSWYAQNAPYETSGKNSLRNLLIPPIAIAISLIFGLLNFVNLLLNIWFLLVKESFLRRWSSFTLLVTFFVVAPKFNHYEISDQQAYKELINHTQNKYGAGVAVAEWVAKTEPYVYPVGNMLRYNVLDGFAYD